MTTHAYGGIVRIKLSSQGIPDTSFGNISNTNSPDSTSPLLLEYKLNNLTLELKFNEDVLVGSGGLVLKNSNNGATQEIIPSALSEGIKENTIRIPLNPYISPSQEYKITLRENFIQDLAGNANLGGSILSIITESPPPTPKFWNNPAKTPSETGKSAAIDLSDAIAILKMIVGLNVNDNRTPLSPYQSLAADFNQNGDVGLEDAIGVLKKIVGLSSPEPTWKYFDDSKVKTSLTGAESLKPNTWIGDASIADLLTASPTVNVVGVLTGDVNGNWI